MRTPKLTEEQEYEIYKKIDRVLTETTWKIWAIGICILAPIWFSAIIFWIDWDNIPEGNEKYPIAIPIIIMLWLLILAIKTLYERK